MSWSFVQLFLVVVILSSIGLSARSDVVAGIAVHRVIRNTPSDWFNGAEPSSEDDDESAGFNGPVKRRRMPFRSDLGKRFRLGLEEEGVEQPFLLREEEDPRSAEKKDAGEKRRKFYRSDMGKRFNRASGAPSDDFQLQ